MFLKERKTKEESDITERKKSAFNLNGNKLFWDGDRGKGNLKKERGHKDDLQERRMECQ